MASTKGKSRKEPEGNVIILNKPFLGGWLDEKGNIGHEIIDFFKDDHGNLYVYNNPRGFCPDDIWVDIEEPSELSLKQNVKKEIYHAKYLILTSAATSSSCEEEVEEKDKKIPKQFFIQYVIELAEKLHRKHYHIKDVAALRKEQEYIENEIIIKRDIRYDGVLLNKIYNNDDSLYVTFRASKIYEAVEPILIKPHEYNFQRNKGYIYSNKHEEDYLYVLREVEKAIGTKLKIYEPKKLTDSTVKGVQKQNTYLSLTLQESNEQIYTNILYDILKHRNGELLKHFCEKYKGDKLFASSESFTVARETKVQDGRIDITAESNMQRIIIENKVFSGLNGLTNSPEEGDHTQLSTYYYHWGKKIEKDSLEPLCFITAPDFRLQEIKDEMVKLDPEMEKKKIYIRLGYSQIASFIKEEKERGNLDDYEYVNFIDDIIVAFNNLSYDTKDKLYISMFREAIEKAKSK